MLKNIIIGQSGGPTSAINSTLAGIFCQAKSLGVKRIYGMWHGIQGLLDQQFVDLSEFLKTEKNIVRLKQTPAAFLGSCRYKLPQIADNEALYEQLFTILRKLRVEAFFYIGGNDSMDTIKKLSEYAALIQEDILFIGVPKTIDNDLALTDHTPGFGSAAKYIAASVKEVIRDAQSTAYKKPLITVMEIMGRNAGWLTGAAALSRDMDCDGPDLIYLPERSFEIPPFMEQIDALLQKQACVNIAVSEGIRLADGTYISELSQSDTYTDSFGHKQLSGTASYLAHMLAAKLGCKTRAVEFSTLQRCAAHFASLTDIEEAYMAGSASVDAAVLGHTGKMIAFERQSHIPYHCTTCLRDVRNVANMEKLVPDQWITDSGTYVTEQFLQYARPLILGELPCETAMGLPVHLVLPA